MVSPAPFDAPGLDHLEGMDPVNVRFVEIAVEGGPPHVAELEREAAAMLERVVADPATVLGDEWELSDVGSRRAGPDRAPRPDPPGHRGGVPERRVGLGRR